METKEINKNQVLSIKSDIIVLIAAAISLFILNWHINLEIIAGIILVMATGYGLSIIFFPKKNDIDFLSRLLLSPILGIFLIGFWSILLNYTPYHETTIYYELAIIPILLILFIIRTIRFLRSKKSISNLSIKRKDKNKANIHEDEYKNLNTAKAAAKAEKEKLMKINKKINTTETVTTSKYSSKSSDTKTAPTPKYSSKSSDTKTAPTPKYSSKSSEMPRPPGYGKKYIDKSKPTPSESKNNIKTGKSKNRWSLKSQEDSKVDKSKEKIEVIKVKKSINDIILVLILTVICGILIFLPQTSSSIKMVFIILLLFFIFGYSVLSGLFIKFSDQKLLKKIIYSVLLSMGIVLSLCALLTFLKIHPPSAYFLAVILVISLAMGILGYLRTTRNHKKVKKSFRYDKSKLISEKSEFNVLTISQKESLSETNLKNDEMVFKKYSLENTHEKPLQNRINSKLNDDKQNLKLSDLGKEKITPVLNDNPSKDIKTTDEIKTSLSPSDARKRVMSRKKDMKKDGREKSKSSHVYDELEKDKKSDAKKTSKPISKLFRSSSTLKLIIVLIFSIIGIIFTIQPVSSFLSSNLGIALGEIVKLIFIAPLLLYLPGYAIKELFIPEKFSGIIFAGAISIVISLSLDILILFGMLYIGHLSNQTGLNQSLYVGILSSISIICILIAFWKSNKKTVPTDISMYDLSKKDSETDKEMEENKAGLDKNKDEKALNDLKEYSKEKSENIKKEKGIEILKEDIALAKKEVKEDPLFTLKKPDPAVIKKPESIPVKKPARKNYLEEDLAKSFSASDIFDDKKENKEIKKPDPSNQDNKKRFIPLDLLIVLTITFLTIISIYVPIISKTPLNSILGLLFVLFIPGYTLIAALFPKKQDLDNIARLALSFGMSLAISPLIGLALNYTPFGIKLSPIVISLTIFTIIMVLISYIRRKKVSSENRFNPEITNSLSSLKQSFNSESRLDKILSIILILSLVLAIATTAYIIVKPKEGEKFTEFYILGPNGKASDYPTNLTLGQSGKLFVGVVNHEYSTVNYKVLVKLQGKIISTENISLKNNQKWEKDIIFTPDASGTNQKLELILYKLPDDKNAYRSLHLWVNVV